MTISKTVFGAAVALTAIAGTASAATFQAEFFDSDAEVRSLADVDALIAGTTPVATFESTAIDYNRRASSGTLAQFIGSDASSIAGDGDRMLTTSATRFTGFLDLDAGEQTFSVASDDGFRLTIGDTVISSFDGPRAFRTTSETADAGQGATAFELLYFENVGNTAVRFLLDGSLAVAADAPSAVPLPAGLPLALAGLGALGLVRRLR